jgi:hypothetical protein
MPESLRLYTICDAMKWNHLPVSGGLYDQDPRFLDDMVVIMSARADADQREMAKARRQQGKGGSMSSSAPRRR